MAFGKGGGKRDFASGRSFSGGRGGRSGGFGDRRGGRDQRSFGGKGFEKGPVTMHKVTCDECGSACEVPFKPSSDKPVFCDSCFGGKRENKRGGDRFADKRSGPSSNDAEMKEMKKLLMELNVKLDVILDLFNDEIEEEDAIMAAEAEEEIEEVAPKAKKAKAEPKKSSSKKK